MNIIQYMIPAQEGYIFNEAPIYNKVEDWESKKTNVLWITGLSGGGKGYTAKKLAGDRRDVTIIGLDAFENYPWFKDQTPDHPAEARGDSIVFKYLNDRYEDLEIDHFLQDGIKYQAHLKKFIDWLCQYMDQHKDVQFIVEGIQIYMDDAFGFLSNQDSMIILRTSMVKSMRRVMHRDHCQIRNRMHAYMDAQGKLKAFIKSMHFDMDSVVRKEG